MGKNIKFIYADIKFTIKPRDGKWHLDYYLNGDRQRGTTDIIATNENLKLVKQQTIPSIVYGLGKNIDVIDTKILKELTLNEYASKYFMTHEGTVRNHVYERNKAHYYNHIAPYFGERSLKSILPDDIQLWQNNLLKSKYLKNKKLNVFKQYSPSAVKKFRSVFFSILERAMINDLINKNPIKFTSAPKEVQKDEYEDDENIPVDPFTEREITAILQNSKHYMLNLIKLMLSNGLRPGEAIALKWKDIDFERKTIRVERTRMRGKDGPPKTPSSKRTIDILPLAEIALIDQQVLTGENDYVFLNSSKLPFYSHDIVGVNFKLILAKSGVKERALYNLRHTFASHMISKGADITWVSKTLGHKNVAITLNVYTKSFNEDDDVRFKIIDKMGTIMGTYQNNTSKNNVE